MTARSKHLFAMRIGALVTAFAVVASLSMARTPIRPGASIQSRFTLNRPAALTIDPSFARSKSMQELMGASVPKHDVLLGLSRQDTSFTTTLQALRARSGKNSEELTLDWLVEPSKPSTGTKLSPAMRAALGSFAITLPSLPKTTADQLATKISQEPNVALSKHHPVVGNIGRSFDARTNRRALQALAQGLKAQVSFDAEPTDFKLQTYLDRTEATDTLNEIVAAGVERALNWRPEADAKLRSALVEDPFSFLPPRSAERGSFLPPSPPGTRWKDDAERLSDLEKLETYMENRLRGAFDRLGQPRASDTGIWGKFVRDAHAQVSVTQFDVDGSGNASIKFNTPEFENMTGHFPLKQMAKELAKNGDDPEVKMLLPRN